MLIWSCCSEFNTSYDEDDVDKDPNSSMIDDKKHVNSDQISVKHWSIFWFFFLDLPCWFHYLMKWFLFSSWFYDFSFNSQTQISSSTFCSIFMLSSIIINRIINRFLKFSFLLWTHFMIPKVDGLFTLSFMIDQLILTFWRSIFLWSSNWTYETFVSTWNSHEKSVPWEKWSLIWSKCRLIKAAPWLI